MRTRRPLSDNAYGYLFLLPWLCGLTLFMAGPTLVSLYLSFTDFNLVDDPHWIAAQNYVRLFSRDTRYMQALRVTFTYVALAVPLNLIFALALAMLLNSKIRGLGFIARSTMCRRYSEAALPSPFSGVRCSARTGSSAASFSSSGARGPVGSRRHRRRCGRWSSCMCGSSARR